MYEMARHDHIMQRALPLNDNTEQVVLLINAYPV